MVIMDRVQKLIAQAGLMSRRKAEEMIKAGQVKVNGKTISLGAKASVDDKITVSGKRITLEKKMHIMLHKPAGYVSTVTEKHRMKTVMDLVKVKQRLFPVGRLDKDTEGLLLLTNDGAFANKLMHPRYEATKTYQATLKRSLQQSEITQLRKGIMINGRKVTVTKMRQDKNRVTLTLHEGRKHIVKRMFAKLDNNVVYLKRTKIKSLELGKLPKGKWRKITQQEIAQLKGD